ncbi:LytTR family DNA-binding domain-containing protein [Sphingomonas sp. GB1N7]
MAAGQPGTSGGWRGMNGAQRRIMALFVAGFLTVVALILVANAESTISDLAASGARIPAHLVWSWEWSSMIGWLSLYPFLWWAVARFKPPRSSWPLAIVLLIGGSILVSGWHIAVMVAIRHVYYDATGHGPYRFFGVIGDRLLYEFRKDVSTYVQFVAMAALVQWLIARAAEQPAVTAARILTIQDGTIRHAIPIDEIDAIRAAGNYVEVMWAGRTLLHRATLTATEAELGDAFARIHRAQLVRREAIRRIATDKSGDFVVTLQDGAEFRGSRRYRGGVEDL